MAKLIQIAQMSNHFLYLPLYYAAYKKFFRLLPGYQIEIRDAPRPSDKQAYEMLMRHKTVDFAICDPISVFDRPQYEESRAVVLAALITNSAFWAVDRGTHTVRSIRDIANYDKIISFKRGTTSYGIAHRIFTLADKKPSIMMVNPGQELTALQRSSIGTIALSPDALGIDYLVGPDGPFNVDFELGSTPEYNNVLVTALITREDVLKDEFLVAGVLRGLQRATLLVRSGVDDVLSYAADRYMKAPDRVARALQRANDSNLYPATIEVSRAHWRNAARAFADATGRVYDDGLEDHASQVFDNHVGNFAYHARAAVEAEFSPLLVSEVKWQLNLGRLSFSRASLVFFVFAIAALAGSAFVPGVQMLSIGAVGIALGICIAHLLQLRGLSLYLHWSAFAVLTLSASFLNTKHAGAAIGIASSALFAEMGLILALQLRHRDER